MNDFVRNNKVSGVYRIKGDMEEVKIKIKLKPPDDILSLPKFEDYVQESSSLNLETSIEEYTFQWQEKSFSAWEIQRYSDIHNCVTESELEYHDILKNNEIPPNKVFSYIHDDYYLPLPAEFKKPHSNLESCLERLSLNDVVDKLEKSFGGKGVSDQHLFKSQENMFVDEKWQAMHVVFDNSDYNEDTALLLKKESLLLSIYYNIKDQYVILSPDVNNIELNPYTVDDAVSPLGFKYEIDVDFGAETVGDDLEELLNKLYKKWEKKHKNLIRFIMPPLGKIQYYVCLELVTGVEFEMDDIYIEYRIKLPEGVESNDTLQGRMHTSRSLDVNGEKVWNFGHFIELTLQVSVGTEPPPLKLQLEVISTDWWRCHRTEGYCVHLLHLTPGLRTLELSCIRPTGDDERRFFIGGCHLIGDLDGFEQNPNLVYTSSGTLKLRWSVISQSPTPGLVPVETPASSASALLLGAEAALRKYKKARAKLAAATRDITELGLGDGPHQTYE